eukprot:1530780-Pyramimonas_sp.AAC.1
MVHADVALHAVADVNISGMVYTSMNVKKNEKGDQGTRGKAEGGRPGKEEKNMRAASAFGACVRNV